MGSELNLWWLDGDELVAASRRVATSIPLRLPFLDHGPGGFEELVRSRAARTYTSAYGSFVADASRRTFVFYVAEYEVGGARGIAALIDRVRAAWPGWRAIWAVGGEQHVRRVLAQLRATQSGDGGTSLALSEWLREPGSPDALASLLGDFLHDTPGAPTAQQARAEVRATIEDCWADASSKLEGTSEETTDLRGYLFREAASIAGTDVTLVEGGITRTARVPAGSPALLVDPDHVAEVLRTGHGPMLVSVEPASAHGPPEAIWLDRDRQRVQLLPTPDHLSPLLDLLARPVWRGWSVRLQPPGRSPSLNPL